MTTARTATSLADGRDLFYYDRQPGRGDPQPDTRDLPEVSSTSELRLDPLLDEWVIVAGHRQSRTHKPPTAECPLCPSAPGRPTEIPEHDYEVVVFENRFPSLAEEADGAPKDLHELAPRRPGRGRCEVVCFTSDHDTSFVALSTARVRTVVDAWADRTTALAAIPDVEQVFPFENRGEEIGVTLSHPHGQIYAYPFVTPRTERMLAAARRHRERTGGELFEDLVTSERTSGERCVVSNDHWTAYVPPAARWPYEVHVVPHRHVPDIAALDDHERDAFAELYLDVLGRLDRLFDGPLPYIAAWHQAPVSRDRDLIRCHLQVFSSRRAADKLKYLAGSESGMGVFINDITPEAAARTLRGL